MADNKKKPIKKIVVISAIAVFAVVMSIWFGSLISKNMKLRTELNEKQKELAGWQEENAALDALVAEENETALMEEYARKAGYVYADERVYIKGS